MKDVFEIIERCAAKILSFWSLWFSLIFSPINELKQRNLDSKEESINSVQFLFFMTVVIMILLSPVDSIILGANYKDSLILVVIFVLYFLSPVIFCIILYGSVRIVNPCDGARFFSSMIYMSAFLPFIYISQYYSQSLSDIQAMHRVLYQVYGDTYSLLVAILKLRSASVIVSFLIQLVLILYVCHKIIPVLAWVCNISFIRALMIFIIAGLAHGVVMNKAYGPIHLRIFTDNI